jgi:hypothetical protein
VAFLVAAFSFVIAVIGFYAVMEWITEKKNEKYEKTLFYGISLVAFLVGLFAFSVGLGAIGFLHTVVTGIGSCIGTAVVVAYFCLTAVTSWNEADAQGGRHENGNSAD